MGCEVWARGLRPFGLWGMGKCNKKSPSLAKQGNLKAKRPQSEFTSDLIAQSEACSEPSVALNIEFVFDFRTFKRQLSVFDSDVNRGEVLHRPEQEAFGDFVFDQILDGTADGTSTQ